MRKNRTIKAVIICLVLSMILIGCDSGTYSSSSSNSVEDRTDSEDVKVEEPIKSETKEDEGNSASKSSGDNAILDGATLGQIQAYRKAAQYLEVMAFSHDGLIQQFEFEKFPTDDATWAVDNCGADWKEQAVLKGQSYLDSIAMSHDGLIDQLMFEGFTENEAKYAADTLFNGSDSVEASAASESGGSGNGSVSQENALKKAKEYLNFTAFSYSGLKDQLIFEGFSEEDATYGVDNCGADWNEQAAKKAGEYLSFTAFSRDGLIDQLEYEGFTNEQAEYGVSATGL